jgi:PAS domain S-box-containing protein
MDLPDATRTVLAADDSPVALALLSRTLKSAGYRVVSAANGIQAAQRTYSESPDLVILDIEMPRMNGYHVCRLLKRDPAVAHIPVIILTAVDDRGTEFWSLRTGADAFLVKSAEPAELLATISKLLSEAPARPRAADPDTPTATLPKGPEEILASVCALMDEELYVATVGRIELKTIVENLRDGVMTLNLAGEVTATNQSLCAMLGRNETQLLGKPFSTVLGPAASESALLVTTAVLQDNASLELESEIEHLSGQKTPVAISAIPLRDFLGSIVGCVCLFHNIERRKELEALYERLKSLDKVKNDLTNMIVHDLRTPLSSLLAGLQSLQVSQEDQEILEISLSGGNTLLGMINNLLDIGKMEEGLMHLEKSTVSIPELVDEAMIQVAWLAEDKRLKIAKEISPSVGPISADADKLRRVIVNLLGNAIKFTPAEGRVTVTGRWDAGSNEIVIGVRDTGEGIPEEAFGRIFEKFEQVATRKAGKAMSTGLGLTFCKLVVEAHGGRIWVESQVGVGSTFIFTLPQPSQASPSSVETTSPST